MSDNPIVSVVIPTYNSELTIKETLNSVRIQTEKKIEILVVDDGSKDGTRALVRSLMEEEPRLRLIEIPRNSGGPAAPRNTGVALSSAPWIAFLDADDIWHPRKLELQLAELRRSKAKLCGTLMCDFTESKELRLSDNEAENVADITFQAQLIKASLPNSSMVVDRSLLQAFPFNEDSNYKAVEDYDCWLRCLESQGPARKIMAPLLGYRVSANQISRSKWNMVRRHWFVLWNFRRKSGARMRFMSFAYTFTHVILSVYHRLIMRQM